MGVMSAGAAATTAAATTTAHQTARLPTGLHLRCVSRRDVPFLFEEIYRRRCYLQHGISLPRGGTVVDCGANIGLFSLLAAEELGSGGLVLSCEPLPQTFDCLQHNVAAHSQWWQQQQQHERTPPHTTANQQQQQQQGQVDADSDAGLARILALKVGLGSGREEVASFTFYPRAAGWSSMRPAEQQEILADMGAFLDQALSSPQASEAAGLDPATAALGRWLRSYAPAWLYAAVWRAAVGRMLRQAETVRCQLMSVSQLIRQYQLSTIDLLKVDVERAELEVLRGVEDCHWPLVRQAALEVHEADLAEVLQILRQQGGFPTVVVEQDAALKGSSLHAVYCRR